MTAAFVADANILISCLDQDNPKFGDTMEILGDLEPGTPIWVHPINLAEVLTFYGSATEREHHWIFLQLLAGFEVSDLEATGRDQALSLADIRHATGASMPDGCALYLAHTKNATLITHDRSLAKAARRLGIDTLPGGFA